MIAELVQIGRVISPWKLPEDVPIGGAPARIEIEPVFEPALENIERASHLVVIAHMHLADRSAMKSSSRKLGCAARECGVFGTRSPSRPNPLSMTVVELVSRDGLVLIVDPLDLVNGTVVLDIKGYSPGWDNAHCAKLERRVDVAGLSSEYLELMLRRSMRNHLGSYGGSSRATATLRALVQAVRFLGVDPRDERLCMEVAACDIVLDALMGMTGATFSSGRMSVVQNVGANSVRFVVGDRQYVSNIE